MANICEITGKRTCFGNHKSHANNKTRRKFKVNLQRKSVFIKEYNAHVPLTISTSAMRDIDKNGLMPTLRKAYKKGTLSRDWAYFVKHYTNMTPQIIPSNATSWAKKEIGFKWSWNVPSIKTLAFQGPLDMLLKKTKKIQPHAWNSGSITLP